jgi:hydroxyacylglutathione hydrolase
MEIASFRYDVDNLSYVVFNGLSAAAVDGGAVGEILAFLAERGLTLQYVVNTHGHADHTKGNQGLLSSTGARLIGRDRLLQQEGLLLDGQRLHVMPTPGHTADSVTFHYNGALITGDTLFNGTVGNCFSGDLEAFYHSILRLLQFPDDTCVYAGHDYVKDAMAAAKYWEPSNTEIDRYLNRYNPDFPVSTLKEERKVNPYLRYSEPQIVSQIRQKGLPSETDLDRWISFMTMG